MAITLGITGVFGFWSMMLFWVLTIGFIYEWKKGHWSGNENTKLKGQIKSSSR